MPHLANESPSTSQDLRTQHHIIHVVAGIASSQGGPSRTVVGLTDALAALGNYRITLLSQRWPNSPEIQSTNEAVERIIVSTSGVARASGLSLAWRLHRILTVSEKALIHIHGLWHPSVLWPALVAKAKNNPLVVHPRGMLEPWALQHHAVRKRVAAALVQDRVLQSAAHLMATAESEKDALRSYGLRNPVAVVPNGVSPPPPTHFEPEVARQVGVRTALFLSRLHPKKNLGSLLRAWATLDTDSWELIVAGPDEHGYTNKMQALCRSLKLRHVTFLPEVDDLKKWKLLAQADLFVLPSFSENFGVVVAEALSQGVPAVATHGTPWQLLPENGCGWWVEPTPEGLANALKIAFDLSSSELAEMSRNARSLAARFSWKSIARQTQAVYEEVLSATAEDGARRWTS